MSAWRNDEELKTVREIGHLINVVMATFINSIRITCFSVLYWQKSFEMRCNPSPSFQWLLASYYHDISAAAVVVSDYVKSPVLTLSSAYKRPNRRS